MRLLSAIGRLPFFGGELLQIRAKTVIPELVAVLVLSFWPGLEQAIAVESSVRICLRSWHSKG